MVGWRLARKRRCARTRFIPTDWGLNPEIESLPQRTQKRAMTFSLLYLAPERDAPPLVPYRSRNAVGLREPWLREGVMPSERQRAPKTGLLLAARHAPLSRVAETREWGAR